VIWLTEVAPTERAGNGFLDAMIARAASAPPATRAASSACSA
jgi:hypothetical protein